MANRLAQATSPYLRQHEHNPVDWQEWGTEALEEARRRDVPILLSVGYAACHWCHVMAHESFEDEQVAAAVNGAFVAIKVDREERPDIDAVYMQATTALTGHGGWPMTCFLTPDGEPFHCGTYYPKRQFLQLLQAITEIWRDRREDVVAGAGRISETLGELRIASSSPIGAEELAAAVDALDATFDHRNGGFGGAPKFPPSMVLEFLFRHAARTGARRALSMAETTCLAMARGGIYDQLAGGSARYSVDDGWVVPHFEKMLYDNAQLLRVYLHWFRATGSATARRVVEETAEFLLRDLGTGEGAFASSLDADTDGVEGLTYVWSPAQLAEVLGPVDAAEAARFLGVTPDGTFEAGHSTLRRLGDEPGDWPRWRAALLEARTTRAQPARDDKVVTSWNGMAVAALAEAGAMLDRPGWVAAATACAEFLASAHVTAEGRLVRSSRDGVAGRAAAVADDYGNLAEGLLVLHQATGEDRWLALAESLLAVALEHFADGDGGFYDTADDAEALVTRPQGRGDNAEPSGTSALAAALLTFSALTGRLREEADAAIAAGGDVAQRDPRFAGWTLAQAEASLAGPVQVAVVGSDEEAAAMVALARESTSPGLVLAHGAPADGAPDAPHPLLAGRGLVGGRSAAYVCRGFVCDLPVTTVADLRAALRDGAGLTGTR